MSNMSERIEGRVAGVLVGGIRLLSGPDGTQFKSAIAKAAVEGPVMVGELGLDGDDQAEKKYHGGPLKAICCFPSEHYGPLREAAGLELAAGAFGENFLTAGLTEGSVCFGDRFEVEGGLVVEVTQPREPCGTVAKRWGHGKLPRLMVQHGMTGWYLRVVEAGPAAAGAAMRLAARPYKAWTIARLNALHYGFEQDAAVLREGAALPGLPFYWREDFAKKAEGPAAAAGQ